MEEIMPLLMKHTGPLWGIWKIEESSEVLLSLLRNREEYSAKAVVKGDSWQWPG
ncbi:hypothetical protein GMD74_22110, partial [Parabacteroides merdae]|nr:hypothetical protein [Parabacteroides merdae]